MRYFNVGGLLAFMVFAALGTCLAQSEPAPSPPKWSLSLGADPTAFDLRTRDPGVDLRMVGNLTRTWQSPGSRFARHISLMLGADAAHSQENCYGCWTRVGKSYAGLLAGTSMDLFKVSRFTPYVQSGLGLYYTRLRADVTGAGLIPNPMYDRSRLSLGVNGGIGVKARLGSHEFFIEETLHAFDVRQIDRGVYPLSIGFRF
jgi:hypothetical protein